VGVAVGVGGGVFVAVAVAVAVLLAAAALGVGLSSPPPQAVPAARRTVARMAMNSEELRTIFKRAAPNVGEVVVLSTYRTGPKRDRKDG
jgi:hypothetical protein